MNAEDQDMNPRTCIVTRKAIPASEMIRFVADPQNRVVPDLKANLPGRGVWVTATKEHVAKAVAKNAFAHGLKCKALADEGLTAQVQALLSDAAIKALAMAKKAGLVVSGFSQVDAEIRKGGAVAVFSASDAAEDGVRKVYAAMHATEMMGGEKAALFRVWSNDELSKVLGRENVMHVAVKYGGAAKPLLERAERFQRFMGETDVGANAGNRIGAN